MPTDHRFFLTPPPTRRQRWITNLLAAVALLCALLPLSLAFAWTVWPKIWAPLVPIATTYVVFRTVGWSRANLARTRAANLLFVILMVLVAGFWAAVASYDSSDPLAAAGAPRHTAMAADWKPAQEPPAEPITMMAWNLNSGVHFGQHDRQLPFITSQLSAPNPVDVYAFTEVQPNWMNALDNAADASGTPFGLVQTRAGRNQRIAVLFNEDRFELLGANEMTGVAYNENHRNPMAVTLFDRESGTRFEVVAVHLARGNGGRREVETDRIAERLRRAQDPVVLLGDLNFDCPPGRSPEGCDRAPYNNLVSGGGLTWVRPDVEGTTTCNPRYSDMLDLAFAGRGAELWGLRAAILDAPRFCAEMADGAHFPLVVEVAP